MNQHEIHQPNSQNPQEVVCAHLDALQLEGLKSGCSAREIMNLAQLEPVHYEDARIFLRVAIAARNQLNLPCEEEHREFAIRRHWVKKALRSALNKDHDERKLRRFLGRFLAADHIEALSFGTHSDFEAIIRMARDTLKDLEERELAKTILEEYSYFQRAALRSESAATEPSAIMQQVSKYWKTAEPLRLLGYEYEHVSRDNQAVVRMLQDIGEKAQTGSFGKIFRNRIAPIISDIDQEVIIQELADTPE